MTAAQKTSKTELIAIYRLEFYKKQNNWKYCSQERKREEAKKKAAKNAKSKLNLTYNINPGPERDTEPPERERDIQAVEEDKEELNEEVGALLEERGDELNEAFVDTGTDENATPPTPLDPPNSPYSPRWSIEHWAAQCRLHWPEPTHPQSYPQSYPQTTPSKTYAQTYDEGPYVSEFAQDHNPEYMDLPPFNTDLPQYGGLLGKVREWEQLGSYKEYEQGWPVASQVCVNRQGPGWFQADACADFRKPVSVADTPQEMEGVEEAMEAKEVPGAGDADWALLACADDWLGVAPDRSQRSCASPPSTTSDSFTRGAALAPHSSETDLLSEESVGAATLPAAALAAAVARHAAALRGLLGEANRRGHQASTSPMEPLYSFDKYPTRDIDPLSYPHYPPTDDVIIAGSFRNTEEPGGAGRGRGRRVQLIGIGMGRPYRL